MGANSTKVLTMKGNTVKPEDPNEQPQTPVKRRTRVTLKIKPKTQGQN